MRLSLRQSLLLVCSLPAFAANSAHAQQIVDDDGSDEHIVTNHTVPPGPGSASTGANYANSAEVLDEPGVNGVGQMIVFSQTSSTGASLGVCTGTLINPRTVITAAHCVHNTAATAYGSQTGEGAPTYGTIAQVYGQTTGVPISFGFNSTNRCLGVTVNGCAVGQGAYEKWRDSGFRSQAAHNIYNGNQVFYLTGAQPVALGGLGEFANADIALVTLDMHVKGVPTWTLLFSPLDGPTHAVITGYGGAGVGLSGIGNLAGIDYRRRSAENMIDALMSWNDQNTTPAIAGPNSTTRLAMQHAIYWTDFDDPDFDAANLPANFFRNTAGSGRNNGYYDFNVLGGPGGKALPREGSTAGGDSGGPLIADQRFDKPVVVGVLTGSISYNGGISTYGQMNVYPPLFAFWEQIVQNNPYVYASAKAGNGNWFDPLHWVQDMDPNYAIIGPDGKLLNALPNHAQVGADGGTDRFGTVCYLNQNCTTLTGTPTADGDGSDSYVTLSGPGSTNFVPDNVEPVNSADVTKHRNARYYDVTLREAGRTTLSQAATIDRLVIDGKAQLDIAASGALKVWTDFTQGSGWLNVDGRLTTDEALIVSGLLTGSGTFDPTFLTLVQGIVAPGGGDRIGTLTIQGDMILASGSALFIDARRGAADQLKIVGDEFNSGILSISNAALVFNKLTDSAAPRHGDKFDIISTTGGVLGTFDPNKIYSFQGVLRPELTYGDYTVNAELRAGSLKTHIGTSSAQAAAFATALDQLRAGSYANLYNLYGNIDLMGSTQLAQTLDALTPRVMGETRSLLDNQSRILGANLFERMALIGTGQAQGLSVTGDARMLVRQGDNAFVHGFSDLAPMDNAPLAMGEGVSGFVSSGRMSSTNVYGASDRLNASQGGSWFASGVEMQVAGGITLGTAAAFSEASSMPGMDRADTELMQASVYTVYSAGDGAYVGVIGSAENGRADTIRGTSDGRQLLALGGTTRTNRLSATAEIGQQLGLGNGLAVTPRIRVGYDRMAISGFEEKGGEAALAIEGLVIEKFEARTGFAFGGTRNAGEGWTFVPHVSADYVQLLSDSTSGIEVRFAAAPEYGFVLPLAGGATEWGEVRGGFRLDNGRLSIGAGYEITTGDVASRNDRAMIDINLQF
ncbi:autotransporter domain-containing protein [Blastomonas marina]|uniref:autotransporter family protein n=1 Tax=Blastomonas marina TaxID=1867408 RepID=UPI002AC9763B|nr:autotransporter domain-containing protein [Blastomonas marina]WPZ04170.1 autotransporter domain-containing protein [Blastomonas marina]